MTYGVLHGSTPVRPQGRPSLDAGNPHFMSQCCSQPKANGKGEVRTNANRPIQLRVHMVVTAWFDTVIPFHRG